ncbi:MAG: glycosyltransferase family 39 protein, partial [Myxococcales bacterium]
MGRRATLAGAIAGTIGMTLWMANREPFWLGPLWGTLITLATTFAWVAWLLPASTAEVEPWPKSALGAPLSLRRPGIAVMLVVAALYLPLLGATSLWDPWETHYGEVAREILSRNDWISLWWAQDKWFWSKPVLLFWMEALSMGALGVDFMPDANPAHVEWALRLPTILMTLAALVMLYETVRRSFGARAGALATLVTATMPQFFFISHQAITDMPLVAAITMAICCLLLAMQEDREREARVYAIGPWQVSLQHVVLFALIVVVLPQATYLISRNISFVEGFGLVAHPDRFLYGSAGNVDIPGNPNPRDQLPHVTGLLGQPFLQGLVWLTALGALAARIRKERRARALFMVAFYFFCAIAFMAKGLLGIAIPGATALFYLLASRRWSLLASGDLRVSLGVLVVSAVSLPWYLAMYVRHGAAFTNRLLIHDHINRLAAGVHGDQGSIEYFVRQFGYATFPWIALAPLALMAAARLGSQTARDDRRQALLVLAMWLLSSFVLFSAMVTKFHHYLLPSIVPAGILIGIALGEVWGPKRPSATMLATGAGLCMVLGFAWLAGDPRGVVPAEAIHVDDWVLQQSRPIWGYAALIVGAVLAVVARRDLVAAETSLRPEGSGAGIGVALLLGACLVAFVGRDLSWITSARPRGDERLIHLFVYNYDRAWPEHLDYRAILTG